MIGTSPPTGVELLGQAARLDAYLEAGRRSDTDFVSLGKPLGQQHLYPETNSYPDAGRKRCAPDPKRLPIHGTLAAYPGLASDGRVGERTDRRGDFGAALGCWPLPVSARARGYRPLSRRTLRLRTRYGTGRHPVPPLLRFHPYLPHTRRGPRRVIIETPRLRHLSLDGQGLPTAKRHRSRRRGAVGDKALMTLTDQSTSERCSRCPVAGPPRGALRTGYPGTDLAPPPRTWCVSSR